MLIIIQRHLNEFLQNTPYECIVHDKHLLAITRKRLRNSVVLRIDSLIDKLMVADLAWRMMDDVLVLIKSRDGLVPHSSRVAISDPMLFKHLERMVKYSIRGLVP